MKLFKILLSISLVVIVVFACKKDEDPKIDPPKDNCENTAYTYENDIKAIINSNCNVTGCHDGVNKDRKPMTNYDELKKLVDAGGVRTRALENKSMPPNGPLSQTMQDKLDCWMKDGSPK